MPLYRWFPHRGARHAVANELGAGDKGQTLCNVPVVGPETSPPKFPDGLWPECGTCDARWRKAEGLPPRRSNLPQPRRDGGVIAHDPATSRRELIGVRR